MTKAKKKEAPAAGLESLFTAQQGVITATQLASALGVQPRTVQKRAQALGAVRAGRVFLLTPAQAESIQAGLNEPGKRGPKARGLAE